MTGYEPCPVCSIEVDDQGVCPSCGGWFEAGGFIAHVYEADDSEEWTGDSSTHGDEWYDDDDDDYDDYSYAPTREPQWGFTASLYTGEHWTEAYGFLGSFYSSYERAREEIDYLIHQYASKYTEWAIERIWIDEDGFHVRHEHAVVLAHSKNAPVWSLDNERQTMAGTESDQANQLTDAPPTDAGDSLDQIPF